MRRARQADERGIALVVTLLLALMVAGMAIGVILMSSNTNLISRFHSSEAMMEAAADGGLEKGRDTLNGTPAIMPLLGFVTLESNVPVRDAAGAVIPGFTRSLYAGPSGNTTGQYGIFASIISVISNARGTVVIRRAELTQDSFSRFARFFNTWTCCMWGNTEVVFGPVHSNQGMAVQTGAPGATFWGAVSVVTSVTNQGSGNWNGGITTGATLIPFPTTTTLTNLQTFATTGNTVVTGYATATATDPDTRIEFVAVDLNTDGDTADPDEGFFRVWKASTGGVAADKRKYVSGRRWLNMPNGTPASMPAPPAGTTATTDPNLVSPNCGGLWTRLSVPPPNTTDWYTADSIYKMAGGSATNKRDSVRVALNSAGRRCFLGGDRRLYADSLHRVSNLFGSWQAWSGWGGAPPAILVNAINAQGVHGSTTATAVAATYWPLSRSFNANFKGVIYVNGSVAVSGVLRGRATVVAAGNVILADDITYVTPPGTTCADILGILTTNNAIIENNSLNTPFNVNSVWRVNFDDTPNETFQSFMLTLGNFTGESFSGDPAVTAPENCGGKSRGCKSIIGGTIQQGVAATFSGSSGWAEQDTYDGCGITNPPPYFPTTGRFRKNRYYEMDPVGFNVANWYAANQP